MPPTCYMCKQDNPTGTARHDQMENTGRPDSCFESCDDSCWPDQTFGNDSRLGGELHLVYYARIWHSANMTLLQPGTNVVKLRHESWVS